MGTTARGRGWFAPNLGKPTDDADRALVTRCLNKIVELNGKTSNEKWPDWKGIVSVDGEEFELAGWFNDNGKGPFLSLRVSPYQPREQRGEQPAHKKAADADDIPF